MSAVLAEFCRSIHRLNWLLISSLGYSVLTIGLICIVLGLTLPVYLLRDIIRNSLGVRLRWLNWLSILLIGCACCGACWYCTGCCAYISPVAGSLQPWVPP